jgi:NADPH-dependent curcumin reductase CurA
LKNPYSTFSSNSSSKNKNYNKMPKEAIVQPDLSVKLQDVEIPKPETDQIIIKVEYSGSNPKDW